MFSKRFVLFGTILLSSTWNLSGAKTAKKSKITDERKYLENENLMEGDILPTDDATSRNAIANSRNLWPQGIVPYDIDPSYPHPLTLVDTAMKHIEQYTCVRFKPRTNEENYVHIFSGEGCYSHVGRIGGAQRLSLHAGCQNFGTVLHELLHAIGFYHAHNRSDRDEYLTIHWGNIEQKQIHNFRKLSPHENKIFFPGKFDFESVMLYGPTAFGTDPNAYTMSAKDPGQTFLRVAQKEKLSNEDAHSINLLYNCKKNSNQRVGRKRGGTRGQRHNNGRKQYRLVGPVIGGGYYNQLFRPRYFQPVQPIQYQWRFIQ